MFVFNFLEENNNVRKSRGFNLFCILFKPSSPSVRYLIQNRNDKEEMVK